MKAMRLVVMLVCLVCVTAYASVIDTRVWTENGHTYHLLSPQLWDDAEAEAVTLGGHLVTVNNLEEQNWVWSTFSAGESRSLFIGLNDVAVEGVFEWVSGEPVDFTYWNINQPDDNQPDGADHVVMWSTHGPNGNWDDTANNNLIHGVVEVIPEPATAPLLALFGLVLARRLRFKIY